MISGVIHRLSGTNGLSDLRTTCKILANIHSVKRLPAPPPWGRFPFKAVNEKVRSGNPTLKELTVWYYWATKLPRR